MNEVVHPESWLPGWVVRDHIAAKTDPATLRLTCARVTADSILPPSQRDPRILDTSWPMPDIAANRQVSPHVDTAWTHRPETSGGIIRSFALAGFQWGGGLKPSGRGFIRTGMPRVCPEHLLIRVDSGNVRLELPRYDRLLAQGSFTCIPAGTAFSLVHLTTPEGEVITVPTALTRRMGTALPAGISGGLARGPDAAPIQAAMENLARMGQLKTPAMIGLAARQMNLLLQALSRLEERPSHQPGLTDDPMVARPLVERFIRLVGREMYSGMTLADFAQELRVSTGVLDRACRCARGRGALDLQYDLRLERAVLLLRTNQDSPARIAAHLGYAGLSHMNRAFVAATGRGADAFCPGGDGVSD